MVTIRKGRLALGLCLLLLAGGCSREQQDWHSAEAVDTIESYARFMQRHPASELASQARARVAQLEEDRDWESAGSADTDEGYRQFLAQYPNGRWAQEARIRIENLSLEAQAAGGSPGSAAVSSAAPEPPAANSSGTAHPGAAAGANSGAAAIASPGAAAAVRGQAAPRTADAASGPRDPTSGGEAAPLATNTTSTSAAAGSPEFAVQLGAFSSSGAADSAWRGLAARFAAELHGLTARVVPADVASGRIYRLQVAVRDETQARSICGSLKQQSQSCVPVLPR